VSRIRLDTLLAERGLAPSRSAAATTIRAGMVRLGTGGMRAAKPGQLVAADAELEIDERPRYVSRGGLKLEAALDQLGIAVDGRTCLDVGASTGGFTDCLLQRGAERVLALDVGRGQLDWSLRNDPRVTVLEGINARHLNPEQLTFEPDLAVIDVSFISLSKVLGPIAGCLAPDAELLAMVKPQFELGPGRVGKGGVVRPLEDRREAVAGVAAAAANTGLGLHGVAPAGVPGPKGNQEVFVQLKRGGAGAAAGEVAIAMIAEAVR
jgi:23S rRNA (cytidine1920-2'-O)/16S rRNA (cytidine1409-2'-O)-methyltransferase